MGDLKQSKHLFSPQLLTDCFGLGFAGVGRAYICRAHNRPSSEPQILFGAALLQNSMCGDGWPAHGNYERHAGTLLWIPGARQVAGPSREGWTIEDYLKSDTPGNSGDDWKDVD